MPGARWPGGDPDISLGRGPAREESLPVRSSRWPILRDEHRGRSRRRGGDEGEPSRLVGKATLGRARDRAGRLLMKIQLNGPRRRHKATMIRSAIAAFLVATAVSSP